MTAVVRLEPYKHPLIVADLLISGPETQDGVSVPTIGPVTKAFPKGSGFVPTGLRQKIALLDDNLVIGWSGSQLAASYVIRRIRNRHRLEPFNRETLVLFVNGMDSSLWKKHGLSLLGYIRDTEGVKRFQTPCRTVNSDLYGRIDFMGTGADELEAYLNRASAVTDFTEVSNVANRAVNAALFLTGSLLNREIATGDSLLKYFGGGYEIALASGGTFKKFDDVTYLFWLAQLSDNGVFTRPLQICKYSYIGDVLMVRTVSFSISKNTTLGETHHDQQAVRRADFIIDPIYRNTKPSEARRFPVPSLDSRWICNYFFVPHEGCSGVYAHISCIGNRESPIKFYEREKDFVVTFDREHMTNMISHAQETYYKSIVN